MNSIGNCIVHELAECIATTPGLRAVWLDAEKKKVSFAFQSGGDESGTRALLEQIVAKHRPSTPDCVQDQWHVSCQVCESGVSRPMPSGVRLLAMPDAGVLLERESCSTASRFLQWSQFQWKVQPRQFTSHADGDHEEEDWRLGLAAAVVCGLFTGLGLWLERSQDPWKTWSIVSYLVAYVAGGWFPAQDVWHLLRKKTLDVHFLMLCVAAGAAFVGHWWEGAILLFLFALSGALEELAMERTRNEIGALFKEAPKTATCLTPSGAEQTRLVESLGRGQIIRVRPGDQFPVDAEVISGTTAADESNLTGESVAVEKKAGDTVLGGTMNLWGKVDCRVVRPASESSLSKIIRLIKNAQESKAPSQRFTDKFGTGYTYGILGMTFVMFLVWWLGFGVPPFITPEGQSSAFYRAMTLLVVASPCALVLSIPSAILAGIAAGAKRGVLFRGGAAIEKLAEIHRVAFDKTGTITTGHLQVEQVECTQGFASSDALGAALSLAHNSTHPVSRAIVREALQHQLPPTPVQGFRSITGQGVEGEVDGRPIKLGRRSLWPEGDTVHQWPLPEPGVTETILQSGEHRARFLLRDEIRESSATLLRTLERHSLATTMLTGDRQASAEWVAHRVGLRDFRHSLHPEDKVAAIQSWTRHGEKVAMVGDGVNDAPSLAASHVGVAMGLRGSDAALEIADVVLMQDRLENFQYAYTLSKRARAIIRQNLAISLGVIVLLVCTALGAKLPLTYGVIGHEGSTLIVVLNSLRLLFGAPVLPPKKPHSS